jgi:hypothetical protein
MVGTWRTRSCRCSHSRVARCGLLRVSSILRGEVAERSIAAVLKTAEGRFGPHFPSQHFFLQASQCPQCPPKVDTIRAPSPIPRGSIGETWIRAGGRADLAISIRTGSVLARAGRGIYLEPGLRRAGADLLDHEHLAATQVAWAGTPPFRVGFCGRSWLGHLLAATTFATRSMLRIRSSVIVLSLADLILEIHCRASPGR